MLNKLCILACLSSCLSSCVFKLYVFISTAEYHDSKHFCNARTGAGTNSQDMYGLIMEHNCYVRRLSRSSYGSRNTVRYVRMH